MKLIYPGPSKAVTIQASGLTVARGEQVDVADDALAADLIAQGWQIAATPKAGKSPVAPKGNTTTPKEG